MILTTTNFQAGTRVSFNTYGPLGGDLQFEGDVAGFVRGSSVPSVSNANINNQNIFPTLPQAVQDQVGSDFSSYDYLILEVEPGTSQQGSTIYVALPWIEPATLQTVSIRNVTVTLTEFEDTDFNRVRELLTLNGYNVSNIADV